MQRPSQALEPTTRSAAMALSVVRKTFTSPKTPPTVSNPPSSQHRTSFLQLIGGSLILQELDALPQRLLGQPLPGLSPVNLFRRSLVISFSFGHSINCEGDSLPRGQAGSSEVVRRTSLRKIEGWHQRGVGQGGAVGGVSSNVTMAAVVGRVVRKSVRASKESKAGPCRPPPAGS